MSYRGTRALMARDFISAITSRSVRDAHSHGHRPVTVEAFGREHYLVGVKQDTDRAIVLLIQQAPAPFMSHMALEHAIAGIDLSATPTDRFRSVTVTDGSSDACVTFISYGTYAGATIEARALA